MVLSRTLLGALRGTARPAIQFRVVAVFRVVFFLDAVILFLVEDFEAAHASKLGLLPVPIGAVLDDCVAFVGDSVEVDEIQVVELEVLPVHGSVVFVGGRSLLFELLLVLLKEGCGNHPNKFNYERRPA